MILYNLRPARPDLDWVSVGWDPALQTYFARVVPGDAAPADVPGFWIGMDRREIVEPTVVVAAVAKHAAIPVDLPMQLRDDRDRSFGLGVGRDRGVGMAGPAAGAGVTAGVTAGAGVDSGSDGADVDGRLGLGEGSAAQAALPYEVFGQVEFARRISEAGGFDTESGAQIAREYANVLGELGQAGEPGAVLRFDVYDVAMAVDEFGWVKTAEGETLGQARERAAHNAVEAGLHAERIDHVADQVHAMVAYRRGLLWVRRSRALHEGMRDAELNPLLANSILTALNRLPQGMLQIPDSPAGEVMVLNAVLAVQAAARACGGCCAGQHAGGDRLRQPGPASRSTGSPAAGESIRRSGRGDAGRADPAAPSADRPAGRSAS